MSCPPTPRDMFPISTIGFGGNAAEQKYDEGATDGLVDAMKYASTSAHVGVELKTISLCMSGIICQVEPEVSREG